MTENFASTTHPLYTDDAFVILMIPLPAYVCILDEAGVQLCGLVLRITLTTRTTVLHLMSKKVDKVTEKRLAIFLMSLPDYIIW